MLTRILQYLLHKLAAVRATRYNILSIYTLVLHELNALALQMKIRIEGVASFLF